MYLNVNSEWVTENGRFGLTTWNYDKTQHQSQLRERYDLRKREGREGDRGVGREEGDGVGGEEYMAPYDHKCPCYKHRASL